MRNRINNNGEEWLSKEMKEIMQCKLRDSNKIYSNKEKRIINLKNTMAIPKDFAIRTSGRIKRKIHNIRAK